MFVAFAMVVLCLVGCEKQQWYSDGKDLSVAGHTYSPKQTILPPDTSENTLWNIPLPSLYFSTDGVCYWIDYNNTYTECGKYEQSYEVVTILADEDQDGSSNKVVISYGDFILYGVDYILYKQ